jgi:hypothetical protein
MHTFMGKENPSAGSAPHVLFVVAKKDRWIVLASTNVSNISNVLQLGSSGKSC